VTKLYFLQLQMFKTQANIRKSASFNASVSLVHGLLCYIALLMIRLAAIKDLSLWSELF